MIVKICGTTNLDDALLSVDAGADALGFIFAPSKRRVTVEQVAAITRELPPGVARVGVFTEPEVAEIAEAVRAADLTAVQMHWGYDAAVVAALRAVLGPAVELWQVVGYPVSPEDAAGEEQAFLHALQAALADPAVAVVLLDSVKGKASGGLGVTMPWARVATLMQQARHGDCSDGPRLLLAGGLTAENVREAIRALRPAGVDAVSGVEASPGRKSPDRLRAFVLEAKRREA